MPYPSDYSYRDQIHGRFGEGGGGEFSPQANRIVIPKFGADIASKWGKIPKSFGARFVYIGPTSEWDGAVLSGGAVGPLVVSVGHPCVVPFDVDIDIRPFRTFGNPNDDVMEARLDLVVLNYVPACAPTIRPPRIYPNVESGAISSVTETLIALKTEWANGVAVETGNGVVVAGAKDFTLFLNNTNASAISWRLLAGNDDGQYWPLTPTGYPTATPTYNTLAAGTKEAYSINLEDNPFSVLLMYARSNAGGTIRLQHALEVRDN